MKLTATIKQIMPSFNATGLAEVEFTEGASGSFFVGVNATLKDGQPELPYLLDDKPVKVGDKIAITTATTEDTK